MFRMVCRAATQGSQSPRRSSVGVSGWMLTETEVRPSHITRSGGARCRRVRLTGPGLSPSLPASTHRDLQLLGPQGRTGATVSYREEGRVGGDGQTWPAPSPARSLDQAQGPVCTLPMPEFWCSIAYFELDTQ